MCDYILLQVRITDLDKKDRTDDKSIRILKLKQYNPMVLGQVRSAYECY